MTAGERAEPVVLPNGKGTGKHCEGNADAARLRTEGWTYQRIADELGFADSSGAHKCVQAALSAMVREPTEVAVHLEPPTATTQHRWPG
jgi:hypothetical protein